MGFEKGVRVVKWQEAGILSHKPRFDSRPGKTTKKRLKNTTK